MNYVYKLPALPYAYDALEPYIDARTMEIHLHKHHQAYIDNVNKALAAHPELQKTPLEQLLSNLNVIPDTVRVAVQNQGGGHYNHSLFWQMMGPEHDAQPVGSLANTIIKTFGSVEQCKEQFSNVAKSRFGSGWAWLCTDKEGMLTIISTANQDTPLALGLYPVLGVDVWEHAYYLTYQSKRADYLAAWWHVVNWQYAQQLYEKYMG